MIIAKAKNSLFLYILLLLSLTVHAIENSDKLLLNDSTTEFNVYPYLYFNEDPLGTLTFEHVTDTLNLVPFVKNKFDEAPNLGFTNSSFWFKFQVKNNLKERKIILNIPYPFLNKLDLYIPDYRGVYHCTTVGDHFAFSKRKIEHKYFLFEIEFWANEQKTIYAHIQCDGEATSFPISIIKPLELAKKNYTEQITLGIYYGILIFAFFLSVFLGLSLKEKLNLYYLLYLLGIGIFQLSLDGLAFQYLWPNNTWLANHIIPMSGSFAVFFLLVFSQELLNTKKLAPKLHRVIWIIAFFDAILHLISLFDNPFYSISLKSLNFIALIANVTILITAIYSFKKKAPSARYFLIAFSLLILGVLVALMKNFGFLPRVFITEYGIQIGSAIEIVLLSFAIAERVKTLKEENQLVQELLVDQLRENNKSQRELNIELEKKVKQRTLEIEEQNKIIEDKNKDITDSINYAKRIQDAILPQKNLEGIPASNIFIYFRPRDIVSGDFYWYSEKNNRIIVAAVDCTGHGVPGAFMSMIGSTLLNKVVNDEDESQPSVILKKLDSNIIDSLKQGGETNTNRDGMDMALCCIDLEKREVIFSGASRPLYLVRNSELIEFKGSAFSIGGFIEGKKKLFEDEIINYQKEDMIYLFSDGYADQFGGEKQKKFLSKNLRSLCTEISKLPLSEQKQMVHERLNNWMGKTRQIDDVMLIGIRL